MKAIPENPVTASGAPGSRIPVRDLLTVYVMVAVTVSLPFWVFIIPDIIKPVISQLWVCVLFGFIPVVSAIILFALFFRRNAWLVLLPENQSMKTVQVIETTAKYFILLYSFLVAVFVVCSINNAPCAISRFIPVMAISVPNIVPSYSFYVKAVTVLLGISISGCLLVSVFHFNTNSLRWRFLRWNLLLWFMLAGFGIIAMVKECRSPCTFGDNCYRGV